MEQGPEGVMTLSGAHQWYRFFSGVSTTPRGSSDELVGTHIDRVAMRRRSDHGIEMTKGLKRPYDRYRIAYRDVDLA